MILSFGDDAIRDLFDGLETARTRRLPPEIRRVAFRRLDAIHHAEELSDLKSPPGNRLEALSGSLSGLHSIRINEQWRAVFRWDDGNASEVRVMDYHG